MSQKPDTNLVEQIKKRFAAGEGVVTLSPSMADEQILKLINLACRGSEGQSFQVVLPRTDQSKEIA